MGMFFLPKSIDFANQYAITFNGVDEYLDGDVHAGSLIFNSPATVAFWLKPDHSHKSSGSVILAATDNPEGERLLIVYGTASGSLTDEVISVIRNTAVNGYSDVSDTYSGAWHHFIVTFDGTTNKFYFNGALQTTQGTVGGTAGDYGEGFTAGEKDVFRWMSRPSASQFGSGILDEMSVWNKVFSDAEALELYNGGTPSDQIAHSAAANLQAWWRCGDGPSDAIDGSLGSNVANRIYDLSGNGYYLTPASTMTSGNFTADAP